jgi:hypothetical protein
VRSDVLKPDLKISTNTTESPE